MTIMSGSMAFTSSAQLQNPVFFQYWADMQIVVSWTIFMPYAGQGKVWQPCAVTVLISGTRTALQVPYMPKARAMQISPPRSPAHGQMARNRNADPCQNIIAQQIKILKTSKSKAQHQKRAEGRFHDKQKPAGQNGAKMRPQPLVNFYISG